MKKILLLFGLILIFLFSILNVSATTIFQNANSSSCISSINPSDCNSAPPDTTPSNYGGDANWSSISNFAVNEIDANYPVDWHYNYYLPSGHMYNITTAISVHEPDGNENINVTLWCIQSNSTELQMDNKFFSGATITSPTLYNLTGIIPSGCNVLNNYSFHIRYATDGILFNQQVWDNGVLDSQFDYAPSANTTYILLSDYAYPVLSTAGQVAEDTTESLATTTSWFPIIITIVAMVALIGLTILIISAIRNTNDLGGTA